MWLIWELVLVLVLVVAAMVVTVVDVVVVVVEGVELVAVVQAGFGAGLACTMLLVRVRGGWVACTDTGAPSPFSCPSEYSTFSLSR